MEYSVERWLNQVVHAHPLLSSVVVEFSTWGVTLFGVLAVGLWLLSPPGDTAWKRACAAGLSAAAVGLIANQLISHVWDRARPYEAHAAIVPLLPRSADPSFPSDHATAALSIAFGVFFVSRRAGWLFLAFAGLVAISRVLAGMHYPSDVLASLAVSVGAGYLTARVAMEPVLVPLINLTAGSLIRCWRESPTLLRSGEPSWTPVFAPLSSPSSASRCSCVSSSQSGAPVGRDWSLPC